MRRAVLLNAKNRQVHAPISALLDAPVSLIAGKGDCTLFNSRSSKSASAAAAARSAALESLQCVLMDLAALQSTGSNSKGGPICCRGDLSSLSTTALQAVYSWRLQLTPSSIVLCIDTETTLFAQTERDAAAVGCVTVLSILGRLVMSYALVVWLSCG